jgi:hypothetical protein
MADGTTPDLLAVALAPSIAMGMTYVAMADSIGLAMTNAVMNQQYMQAIANACVVRVVAMIIEKGAEG